MDAARTARRLGAEEALIVYRRTREQMPALEEEAQDAEREGVRINWLRTIKTFEGPDLKVEVMELDDSGFPQPTGRFETLAADTVILALGQETDTAFLRTVPGVEFDRDGTVQVSTAMMTGCPGVFAGGDMVPSERTVTIGVGHGKRAAREIDAWLRGAEEGARRSTRRLRSRCSTCGTSVMPPADSSPSSSCPSESPISGRWSVASRRSRRRSRRTVPVVRKLLRVRWLSRGVPGGRGDQARQGIPIRVRLRPLHGLRGVLRAVPRAFDRDVPESAPTPRRRSLRGRKRQRSRADARHDRR